MTIFDLQRYALSDHVIIKNHFFLNFEKLLFSHSSFNTKEIREFLLKENIYGVSQ